MALAGFYNNPQASAFLLDPGVYGILEGIAKEHGLPIERSEEFLDLTEAVMDEVITPAQMPALLTEAFEIDEVAAQKLSADILGQRLLPFEFYIQGLREQIVAWGGRIDAYPTLRISRGRKDNLGVLMELIGDLGFKLNDVVLKRLLFLLEQFAKEEKTEEALKMYFVRSLNIGGLGLTEEQATALLAATLPQAANFVERLQPTVAPIAPKLEAVPVAQAPAVVAPKQELEIAPSHELAAEVPIVNAPPALEIPPLPLMPVVVPPPVEAVAAKVVSQLEPENDPSELRAPAKQAAAARKFTESSQDLFATALVTATEEAAVVLKKNKISEKVFADLAGKAIRGVRDIYQTRDLVERDWDLKGQDLATLMQAIGLGVDAYQSAPQPMASAKSAAKPRNDEAAGLNERFSKLTEGDTDVQIQPVRAQLTVGSSSLKTPEGQRKMVDVISASRLAGPIEQLGKMSPTEFRRLSSNASEAGQKLEDLLSALETTSYEERVKGVLAWRESPMNQLYLQITQEALSQGLTLPEVSSRRRAAGKESLSPAEIKALALLNTKIRF